MQNVWMITGASGGLGKGIAEAALRRGDAVALTSRSPEKLNAMVAEFPKQAMGVKLQQDRIGSMEKALHQVYARFGRIDMLVNNAGHGYRAAIEESEPTQVRELFETDFFAPILCADASDPAGAAGNAGAPQRHDHQCIFDRGGTRCLRQWLLFRSQRRAGTGQ